MPTLLEYFKNDFPALSLDRTISLADSVTGEQTDVHERIVQDINSSARLFTFYVPAGESTGGVCHSLLSNLETFIKNASTIDAIGGFHADVSLGVHNPVYSNRVYIYTESLLSGNDRGQINAVAIEKGLHVTLRSTDYLENRMKLEKPLAFISHDSRDKDQIARPIAFGLSSRLCTVWYDEYSLKIGDGLRESIEKGIKEAKKCVVILTPNFLNNPGWGKKEFNSIFTREMVMEERIVLPIWFGVTKEQIYEYSPSLADTVALIWPSSDDCSEDEYKQLKEQLLSKLHTAITT